MIPLPGVTYKAEVCSLRNNSWRLIAGTDSFMEGVIVDDMWRSRAVVKNAVHWCGALKGEVDYKPIGIGQVRFGQ